MIFAAATEEHLLQVFADEDTAIAYCEGLDVEARVWIFWDRHGVALAPEFSVPNKRGLFAAVNGEYRLVPNRGAYQAPLQDVLPHIRAVVGEAPMNSVPAVRDYLRNLAAP